MLMYANVCKGICAGAHEMLSLQAKRSRMNMSL